MSSNSVWFDTVVPVLGSLLGFLLLSSPLRVLPEIVRTRDLKSVNPLPGCMLMAACVSWSIYGSLHPLPVRMLMFYTNWYGAICGTLTVVVMYPLASRSDQKKISTVILILVAVYIPLCFTLWSTLSLKMTVTVVGCFSSTIQMGFFVSPLLGIRHVIKSKNTASIDWVMALLAAVCGGFWFVYGIAIKDIFILVTNLFGMITGLVQVAVCVLYPSRIVLEINQAISATRDGDSIHASGSSAMRLSKFPMNSFSNGEGVDSFESPDAESDLL